MIISQTPYRVSFAGGGTDMPAFYQHDHGAVLSTAIKRHMYVNVHSRFEPNIRLAYSRTETADRIDQIEHEIARESLRITELDTPLEITTIGDVPAGTGMGSSSTLTVGLLNALSAFKGRITSARQLADDACRIEIDILNKPIGRQDQFAAAFGGFNYMRFNPNHTVDIHPLPLSPNVLDELQRRVLIFYTNGRRSADDILARQRDAVADKQSVLRHMRDLAAAMADELGDTPDLDRFAQLLHEGWMLKRSLGFGISNAMIDHWYETARAAGAQAGKLLGAGGHGFLLLLAPPERHDCIRTTLDHPRELPFEIDRQGSRIIFISDQP